MRLILKRIMLMLTLCACMALSGCVTSVPGDPLAPYGADAELPIVTPAPTEAPTATPLPTFLITPAPTRFTAWVEVPLTEDEHMTHPRLTRRPTAAPVAVQMDEFVMERQNSELDNTGALQPNISGAGMACVFDEGEQSYLYFTAADGMLYRQRLEDDRLISWDVADAQLVTGDRAFNMLISLQGDIVYISDHRQLVRLHGGSGTQREVMATFDHMCCLTRWDDTFMFIGERDGVRGVFALRDGGSPALIIPSAQSMQLDVVERRIVALDDTGIRAYSMSGDLLAPMIEGEITALCYSGANLYYAAGSAIYCLAPSGTVKSIVPAQVKWLGCHDDTLFYIDTDDVLYRADVSGENVMRMSPGKAYNPTVLDGRIAYSVTENGGISADAEY